MVSLTLKNFIQLYQFPLETIYKRGNWQRLTFEAGVATEPDSKNEKYWQSCVGKK